MASPWSVPRPDGPLAAALRVAQAQREQCPIAESERPVADIPAEVLPDLKVTEAARPPSSEALAREIETLAREARERHTRRQALAIALEWPDNARSGVAGRRTRRWWGWVALAGMVVLAGAAATVAVSMSGDEAAGPLQAPLKLEKRLSLPR